MRGSALALFVALGLAARAAEEDWPQFRGPAGQGHSSERGLPLTWSPTENIRWKVPIAGRGWSSPAVQGNQIWLTTATDRGRSLRAVAIDSKTGRVVHDVEVFRLANPGAIQEKNSHASPTPVIEGDRVYLHFGYHGTACISTTGEVIWKTRLDYQPQHGPGGSPALYQDLLIVSCDGFDAQYVVALDKRTGRVRWKRSRRSGNQAYTTPLVISVNGQDQVVSVGAFWAFAYDPLSGAEIWRVSYADGFSNVPRPVFGHGLVYICTGFQEPSMLAVRADGKGDVTSTHVAWTARRGVPLTPSPLLAGDELYFVSDTGIASCLDARTGRQHWQQRLGGNFSASPVYADGRIYFLNEDGETTVIAPGREFRRLAVNRLEEPALASMAVSDGALFIRTASHLYRIEQAGGAAPTSSPK